MGTEEGHEEMIAEVIAEAEYRFEVVGIAEVIRKCSVTSQRARDARRAARAWVMTELARRGLDIEPIAQAMRLPAAAVMAAIGLTLDEDEVEEPARRTVTRMLPVQGERCDCANESACLDELLRACRPKAPRFCSCPPACPYFRRPGAVSPSPGLACWDDTQMPPDPDPDPAPNAEDEQARREKIRQYAGQRTREGGRFVRQT